MTVYYSYVKEELSQEYFDDTSIVKSTQIYNRKVGEKWERGIEVFYTIWVKDLEGDFLFGKSMYVLGKNQMN